MHPEYKKRWIDALLSGDYKQGRFSLRRTTNLRDKETETHRYCCLGVLCELLVEDGIIDRASHASHMGDYEYWDKNIPVSYRNTIPYNAMKLLGISGIHTQKLIDMNDINHAPFSEIADYIKHNL